MVSLSLVVPAFNEADRLKSGFERLEPTLVLLGESNVEVIVIDDGSSDDTLRRAQKIYGHLEHARFVQHPKNLGKGAALRLGLALATGDNVVTLDADMAIDPAHLSEFIAALETSDLVPGSRAVAGRIEYESRLRTMAGAAFNRLVRHYTHTTLRDTQCGSKAFRLGPARLLGLLSMVDGFAFDVEVLFLAEKLGLDVTPLFVTWSDVGGSSVHPGREARSMLRDIRATAKTRYENPVVELDPSVRVEDVAPLAAAARLQGLVLARGDDNSLLVLGRDAALGGLGVATALAGTLRTTRLEELRSRHLEAV